MDAFTSVAIHETFPKGPTFISQTNKLYEKDGQLLNSFTIFVFSHPFYASSFCTSVKSVDFMVIWGDCMKGLFTTKVFKSSNKSKINDI